MSVAEDSGEELESEKALEELFKTVEHNSSLSNANIVGLISVMSLMIDSGQSSLADIANRITKVTEIIRTEEGRGLNLMALVMQSCENKVKLYKGDQS